MANKLRHLQLFRNTTLAADRATAKSNAEGQKSLLKDGDVIAARYLISEGAGSSANTAVAIGHMVGNGSEGYLVYNDPQELKEMITASTASTENLEKAVGVAHNASAITFGNNTNYIGTSGSASGALVTLDTTVKTVSGDLDNLEAVVGAGANATTLGVDGNYVVTGDTVKEAVTKLDTNLKTVSGKTDSGITAFNNYTTQVIGRASGTTGLGATGSNITTADTVQSAVQKLDAAIESGDTANDNLRKAVGAASGASTMSYTGAKYISTDTTVSGALMTLDSNLYTVSGKADSALTLVDNAEKVLGVGTGATNLGITSANYVPSTGTVKEDIEVLDSKLAELSGSSTDDVDNLRKAVGVASGATVMTYAGTEHYISAATANTVSGALVTLDTAIHTVSGDLDTLESAYSDFSATTNTNTAATRTMATNLDTIVGVASGDTALGASGQYVSGTTVKGALQNLNDAITGSTDNLEKLAQAVGVATGTSEMSFPSDDAYISGQTTVSGALDSLNDSLATVSGDLDTLESAYDGYTAATDASIQGLAKALGVASGATAMTLTGNYINGIKTASGALVTLDTVEKNTRDAIGLTGSGNTITLSGEYISGATTVKSGLEALDTNLAALSGSVTANKITGDSTISVSTAETGTTIGVNLNSTTTDAAISAAGGDNMHKNILSATTNGLLALADLHYTAATNTLEFVNTNGKTTIQLSGLQALSSATYNAATESIDLVFAVMSGGTSSMSIPVSGLIEEYDFQLSETPTEQQASSDNHNVSLVEVRNVAGKTNVYGEVSVYDCGTY